MRGIEEAHAAHIEAYARRADRELPRALWEGDGTMQRIDLISNAAHHRRLSLQARDGVVVHPESVHLWLAGHDRLRPEPEPSVQVDGDVDLLTDVRLGRLHDRP